MESSLLHTAAAFQSIRSNAHRATIGPNLHIAPRGHISALREHQFRSNFDVKTQSNLNTSWQTLFFARCRPSIDSAHGRYGNGEKIYVYPSLVSCL